ncbi:MAG: hypothetical protein KBT34_09905 [Prevotella sp.]|nr:hypothetical protein [Candidatus Prevotella equi]
MGKIVIEEHLEEFEVVTSSGRTAGVVCFNPADTGLAKRYGEVAEKFENMRKLSDETDEECANRLNQEIRDIFDYLLGQPCSDVFFAEAEPLAILQSGDLYCEGVLNGIAKAVEEATNTRIKRVRTKVDKYAKKYHK